MSFLSNLRPRLPHLSTQRARLVLGGIAVAGVLATWAVVGGASGSPDPDGRVQRQEATATVTPRVASATALSRATPTPPTKPTATAQPIQAAGASSGSTGASSAPSSPRPAAPGPASGSGMRFVIPRFGVNAPVNIRVVGGDGVMHNPNGPTDVVWYDFSAFGGLGGYPGSGGNAVFAGHVDYHNYGPAVFWNLRNLVPGDTIEVYLADGGLIRYAVQWSQWAGPTENFATYTAAGAQETITLVTCVGTFNAATREYSNRLVVRGVRVP